MSEQVQAQPLQQDYPRFRLMARIEHLLLLVSFTILAFTGLPQMYAESPISQWIINALGGIETIRIVHRWSAMVLVLGTVYHLITSTYRLFVRHERNRMLPRKKDVLDLSQWVRFNIGMTDEHPKMPKFNFGEKVEYWAVVWGTAVMVITGFMLWNPIAVTSILPGQVIPAAKVAHGGEAVLAVLSIIIWHLYNVLIKNFNPSMWTGNLPREQMEEEHALELERIEAGGELWPHIGPEPSERRRRIFLIASVVTGIVAVVAIYWLFTFEETAITTLPPVATPVFTPTP